MRQIKWNVSYKIIKTEKGRDLINLLIFKIKTLENEDSMKKIQSMYSAYFLCKLSLFLIII